MRGDNCTLGAFSRPLFIRGVRGRGVLESSPVGVLRSWGLKLEVLRAERLPQPRPGGLDELGVAYDPLELLLGAVAPHVVFSEHLLEGHVLVQAADHVPEDLLLALVEGGASAAAEEPLPEGGSLLAHLCVSFRLVCPWWVDLTSRSRARLAKSRSTEQCVQRGVLKPSVNDVKVPDLEHVSCDLYDLSHTSDEGPAIEGRRR